MKKIFVDELGITDLKINTNWQALDKKNNKKDLLVLNLAGEKSKNINFGCYI